LFTVTAGLLLFPARALHAQTVTSGLKLGIDFAALPNAGEIIDPIVHQTSVDTASKVGLMVGGFVRFAIRERLAFQPELLFVMKGVKLDEAASGGTVSARVNYLEFPLLARYAAPVHSGTAYVIGGPSFSIKASTSAHLDTSSQTVDENIDSAIRNFDTGLTFGAGWERGRYLVEARYTLGLTDIATDTSPHADSLRNRVFGILVGIKLK
jgi:hypothetical protein